MTHEEIEAAAEQIAASWPPLTREQVNTVNHIMSPVADGAFSYPHMKAA
ncbi:hypothetical protein [Micrococcus luteus]|jgi:hypothetical protein